MTIDEQIASLLAKAEPLRALPAEEAEAAGLGRLVEQVNRLRAHQAKGDVGPITEIMPMVEGADAVVKRGPGRPRKADQ